MINENIAETKTAPESKKSKPFYIGNADEIQERWKGFSKDSNLDITEKGGQEKVIVDFFDNVFQVEFGTLEKSQEIPEEIEPTDLQIIPHHRHPVDGTKRKLNQPAYRMLFEVDIPGQDGRVESGEKMKKMALFIPLNWQNKLAFVAEFFYEKDGQWQHYGFGNDLSPSAFVDMSRGRPPLLKI